MFRLIAAGLASPEIRESACFVMDISDLPVALGVDFADSLTGRSTDGLLEVGVQSVPCGRGFVGDAVGLVHGLGAVGRLVLSVEVGQGLGEAIAEAVLVVERDSRLDHVVGEEVAVRQILGDDARAGLVFLFQVIWVGPGTSWRPRGGGAGA